jgi:hypothetical protein
VRHEDQCGMKIAGVTSACSRCGPARYREHPAVDPDPGRSGSGSAGRPLLDVLENSLDLVQLVAHLVKSAAQIRELEVGVLLCRH